MRGCHAGKGSVKEGAQKDPKYDYGEDEELHVMITGNTQDDVSGLEEGLAGNPKHTQGLLKYPQCVAPCLQLSCRFVP